MTQRRTAQTKRTRRPRALPAASVGDWWWHTIGPSPAPPRSVGGRMRDAAKRGRERRAAEGGGDG